MLETEFRGVEFSTCGIVSKFTFLSISVSDFWIIRIQHDFTLRDQRRRETKRVRVTLEVEMLHTQHRLGTHVRVCEETFKKEQCPGGL